MLRKTKADIGKSPHQLFVLVCVSEIVAAVYQIIICYFTAHEHYQEETDIKAAVDAALTYLSDAQQADGGFMSWGAANSESCAQVIVALTALGIDPAADSRFVKNGASPLDGLCAFACEGGGFRHSDEVWLPSRASTHWPPATASGRARHACST